MFGSVCPNAVRLLYKTVGFVVQPHRFSTRIGFIFGNPAGKSRNAAGRKKIKLDLINRNSGFATKYRNEALVRFCFALHTPATPKPRRIGYPGVFPLPWLIEFRAESLDEKKNPQRDEVRKFHPRRLAFRVLAKTRGGGGRGWFRVAWKTADRGAKFLHLRQCIATLSGTGRESFAILFRFSTKR